jgi:hypothetical protein
MSTPNVGQIVATSWKRVVTDKPEDQVFGDRWLFDQFTTSNGGLKKLDGGEQIEVTLQYATNTTFRSYSDMETLDVQRIDVLDAALYDWKEHSGTVTYSIIQEFKNSGEGRKVDVIASLVENAIESHKDDLSEAMFADGTGNGSKDIHGLQLLVPDDPTTGTVGSINRATFTFWRSNQITDGGASFSTLRANMRTMYNDCSKGMAGQHPTTLVTDQTVFEGYESLLTTNERFTDKANGDAGYKNEALKFKGAKIGFDEDCGASRMYFLNPKFICLYVSKKYFMDLGKELEPVNQNIRSRKVLTIAQFVAKQPRRLGVITSIA